MARSQTVPQPSTTVFPLLGQAMPPDHVQGYPPIRDYALIGDCHGRALVSRDGSIDWCCLGRFDADPIFCRILDTGKGGFLSVRPVGEYQVARAYLDGTNILRTTFTTESGKVAVTDFMPVGRAPGAGVHDYVSLNAPFWLVRIVEGLQGAVQLRVDYRPSLAFARRQARLTVAPGGVLADDGPSLYTDVDLSLQDDLAGATVEVHAGQRRYLVGAPVRQLPPAGLRGHAPPGADHVRHRWCHRLDGAHA